MIFHHRIWTIYAKELTDILRDRRTLIAMIVVPIVLYPLLMLGSIQAVSYQAGTLAKEEIVIGVLDESHGRMLYRLIHEDAKAIDDKRQSLGADSQEAQMLPTPLEGTDIRAFASRRDIQDRVRDRTIQVGVIFTHDALLDASQWQTALEFFTDMEDMRSASAHRRLAELIDRTSDRIVQARKARAGLPETFDQPFVMTTTDLSSPPSILGQILPLILVLMTITGAIYPAIDLTAGERERGTLESLMVSPVPVVDLIIGKFLVVTTVAMMGAALNLASVAATVHFGGLGKTMTTTEGGLPIGTMLVILLCLIPFAVLMSAIMIAVCSYARTFKEAQNYVTPVILAVLVPGGIAALPATRLDGIMLVMPVGNMVLLSRDFLLGAVVSAGQVMMVLLSTTLYAAAAVAMAANVFGKESVVFADAGSLKSAFRRRSLKPADKPTVSMVMLVVALLFPVWFFIQSSLSPESGEGLIGLLYATAWLMPALFVGVPVLILLYWRVDVANSLALRVPRGRHLLAGILIGVSAWIPARELTVLQFQWFGMPEAVLQSAQALKETLSSLPKSSLLVLIALVPAVCEELLFRGFLLTGLCAGSRKWGGILLAAGMFGVFHFLLFKFPVTAALGVVLGYLCWQSRSVIPAITAHFLHNAISALLGIWEFDWVGDWTHLPIPILIPGCIALLIGIVLASHPSKTGERLPRPAMAEG